MPWILFIFSNPLHYHCARDGSISKNRHFVIQHGIIQVELIAEQFSPRPTGSLILSNCLVRLPIRDVDGGNWKVRLGLTCGNIGQRNRSWLHVVDCGYLISNEAVSYQLTLNRNRHGWNREGGGLICHCFDQVYIDNTEESEHKIVSDA